MPLRVECPACSATLTAQDASAGKTVRCPKCGARMTLPAADEPEQNEEPTPAGSPEEEDEGEEQDERPKMSRTGRKKKKKSKPTIWVSLGAGFVIHIAVAVPVARVIRITMLADRIETREQEREAKEQERLAKEKVWKPEPGWMDRPQPGTPATPKVTTDWTRFEVPFGEFVVEFPPGCTKPEPTVGEQTTSGDTQPKKTWSQSVGTRFYMVGLRYLPLKGGKDEPDEVAEWGRFDRTRLTTRGGFKAQKYVTDSKAWRTGEPTRHFVLQVSLSAGRVLDVTVLGGLTDTWETPEVAQFFARVKPKAP